MSITRPKEGSYGGKESLNKAFRTLRKAGYLAKQNFMCCSSCGWAEINAIPDDSKKAVFYHTQDADDLKDYGNCHLSWRGDGHEIVRILVENGVDATWDGHHTTRIEINIGKKTKTIDA